MNNDRYYPPNTDLSFEGPTLEEERELFRKMKKGDAAARELIIKNHLLFVANEARKLARGKFPDNDVVSAANEALMEAVDRGHFDFDRGSRFTGYLRPFIRGAISELWKERARSLGLPETRDGAQDNQPVPMSWDSSEGVPVVPTTVDHEFEEQEYSVFIRAALEKCRACLTAREKTIVRYVYDEGWNLAQVGRKLKVTRERIRQMHVEILAKLQREMKKQGIHSR